jgi:hypothetical protein
MIRHEKILSKSNSISKSLTFAPAVGQSVGLVSKLQSAGVEIADEADSSPIGSMTASGQTPAQQIAPEVFSSICAVCCAKLFAVIAAEPVAWFPA